MSIEMAKASLEVAAEIEDEDDPTGKRRQIYYLDSIAESLVSIASALNYANNREDI